MSCLLPLLYLAALDRTPALPEIEYWAPVGRDAAHHIIESAEANTLNRSVGDYYRGALGREPDPAGLAYWIQQPKSEALWGIATSAEAGCPPAETVEPSGVLTLDQMLMLAHRAGFRGDDIPTAVAIAMGESRWNTDAHNGTGRDDSWGLWQINVLAHGTRFGSTSDLRKPSVNAAAAYALHVERGFRPWTVYTKGTYRQWLPEARARANELGIR